MSARSDVAVEKFLSGYNCAQAVLYSFCDDLGFDKDTALRLACGMGAGMARKQEVCGAITGGIITLGLKHGRGEGQDRTPTEETYRKVRELMSQFESKHGTCICRTLLKGCDLNTPERTAVLQGKRSPEPDLQRLRDNGGGNAGENPLKRRLRTPRRRAIVISLCGEM